MNIGSLIVSVAADISEFAGAMGDVVSTIASLPGQAVSASAGIGGAFMGALGGVLNFAEGLGTAYFQLEGFVGLVRTGISALFGQSAAMEQAQVAFTTLTGSASRANALLQQLWTFASHTPFLFPNIVQDAQRLMAVGISAQQVIPDISAMGNAVSALGGSSTQLGVLVHAFQTIESRGKLGAASLYEMERIGVPALQILATELHTTEANVSSMVRRGLIPANEAVQLLTAGFNQFYGGALARQALTFNGLMTTLADNIRFAWMAFIGPAFNAAKAGLLEIVMLTSNPAFQAFAQTMGVQLANALSIVGNVIGTVVMGFRAFFSALAPYMPVIAQFANILYTSVVTSLQSVSIAFRNELIPAIEALGPAFASLAPTVQLVGQVLGFVAGIIGGTIVARGQVLAQIIQSIATFIDTDLVPAIYFVAANINTWASQVASVLIPALQNASAFIEGSLVGALRLAQQALQNIESWWGRVAAAVQSNLVPALRNLWSSLQPTIQFIGGLITIVAGAIASFARWAQESGTLARIASTIGAAFIGFIGVISTIITWISNLVRWFTTTEVGLAMLKGILIVVGGLILVALIGPIATLVGTIGGAIAAVAGFVSGIAAAAGAVALVWGGLSALIGGLILLWQHVAIVRGAFDIFGRLLGDIGSSVLVVFRQAWQQLVNTWQQQLEPTVKSLWASIQQLGVSLQPLLPVLGAIAVVIGAVLVVVIGVLLAVIRGLITGLGFLFEGIATAIGGVVKVISGLIQILAGVISFVVDLFTGNFNRLPQDIMTIWGGLGDFFGGLWDIISGIIGGALHAIIGLIGGFIGGIISFFEHLAEVLIGHSIIPDMMNAILSVITSVLTIIASIVLTILSAIANTFRTIAESIVLVLQVAFNIMRALIAAAMMIMQGNISGGLGAIHGIFSSIWAGIVSVVQGAVNNIIGIISGMVGFIQGAISNVEGVIQGAENLAGNVGNFISSHIPGLASGVQNFTGGLAIVGERGPELVSLPRGSNVLNNDDTSSLFAGLRGGGSAIPAVAGTSSGGFGAVNVSIEMDGMLLAQKLGVPMTQYIRMRTGLKV